MISLYEVAGGIIMLATWPAAAALALAFPMHTIAGHADDALSPGLGYASDFS